MVGVSGKQTHEIPETRFIISTIDADAVEPNRANLTVPPIFEVTSWPNPDQAPDLRLDFRQVHFVRPRLQQYGGQLHVSLIGL